jgi:hypothetical protein
LEIGFCRGPGTGKIRRRRSEDQKKMEAGFCREPGRARSEGSTDGTKQQSIHHTQIY